MEPSPFLVFPPLHSIDASAKPSSGDAQSDAGLFLLQDLSKWKNRRRSVNSDIVKKKEERETIEQITYGNRRRSKTFKEMQEER